MEGRVTVTAELHGGPYDGIRLEIMRSHGGAAPDRVEFQERPPIAFVRPSNAPEDEVLPTHRHLYRLKADVGPLVAYIYDAAAS